MTRRSKLWFVFSGIVLLALVAGFVDLPKSPVWAGAYIQRLQIKLGLDLQGGAHLVYEADMTQIASTDRSESLNGVRDVIERRVNAFGVSEPVIQTSTVGENHRVIVELPGVTDVNQAIDRIGKTPLLEFRVPPLAQRKKSDEEVERIRKESEDQAKATLLELQQGADFEAFARERSDDTGSAVKGGDLDFAAKGTFVPEFEDVVFNKAQVGVVYPEIVETSFGYHIIRVEEKRTVTPEEGGDPSEEVRARHILFEKQDNTTNPLAIYTYERTDLTGSRLERADVQFDQLGNPSVTLQFDEEGAKIFEKLTTDYQGEQIAIFLDNAPISAPVVNQPITGGEAVISGSFTVDEARELARNLNAGALPVPIQLVSQQNIGPSLGQVSIERSLFAGLLGFLAVAFFMIVYYRFPGLMSVLALTIYLMIVLAIFKIAGITMTLAGIAGFILSIGLAVDANVLIFERMREELRSGKSAHQAIEDGFARAWLSIRDSNVSSLITCLILVWFGTSLIQGFAITLAIGILASMFTAITVTRTFLRLFVSRKVKSSLL